MGEVHATARTLGLEVVVPLEIRQAEDIEPAFERLKGDAKALYVCTDALTDANGNRINALALAANLPTVEMSALTGQRREEAARCLWSEIDFQNRIWTLPNLRTKNAKPHIVHLSDQAIAVLRQAKREDSLVFSLTGEHPFQDFSNAKRLLDVKSGVSGWRLHDLRRTCVSGMAALGVAPHVADKILNHQSGTISGVAAVYQRHQFLSERKEALERWGARKGSGGPSLASPFGWGLPDRRVLRPPSPALHPPPQLARGRRRKV
jgi:integrase